MAPDAPDFAALQQPRLLKRVRGKIRLEQYSIRAEDAYLDGVRRLIQLYGGRHPVDMGTREVEAFLTHLSVQGKVAASRQNQAKSVLLLL